MARAPESSESHGRIVEGMNEIMERAGRILSDDDAIVPTDLRLRDLLSSVKGIYIRKNIPFPEPIPIEYRAGRSDFVNNIYIGNHLNVLVYRLGDNTLTWELTNRSVVEDTTVIKPSSESDYLGRVESRDWITFAPKVLDALKMSLENPQTTR